VGNFFETLFDPKYQPNEQIQKTKQQAGRAFKSIGSQLGKINLGNVIDKMEQDQGLADSLEKLNSRMKEEVERQEVRREAEELTIRVITDHLDEFLTKNPVGTYEEWIQDLHPENANQGQLFNDIQQIDERFYVMESDHRKLWNHAIEKQEKAKHGNANNKDMYAYRLVKPRTQIWGKAPGAATNVSPQTGFTDTSPGENTTQNPLIDLLSDSVGTGENVISNPTSTTHNNQGSIEEIDFFAPAPVKNRAEVGGNADLERVGKGNDPFADLIQF